MKYCVRCVTPDTRPNIRLDALGVCNACRAHASRPAVDWTERERHFRDVAANPDRAATGTIASSRSAAERTATGR